MKYSTALKVMNKEADFLGRSTEWIMEEIEYNPGMFPSKVHEAVNVITLHNDPDPGAFNPDQCVECF